MLPEVIYHLYSVSVAFWWMLGRVGLGTTLWTDAQAPLVWQCGNQKGVEVTRMGWYLMSVTGAKVCLFGTCWMQSGRQFICYSETNYPHQSYPHVMSDLALTSPPLCFCPRSHTSLGAMKSYNETLRAGAFAGFWGFLCAASSSWFSFSFLLIRPDHQCVVGAELQQYLTYCPLFDFGSEQHPFSMHL